jgi:hypothetical protein
LACYKALATACSYWTDLLSSNFLFGEQAPKRVGKKAFFPMKSLLFCRIGLRKGRFGVIGKIRDIAYGEPAATMQA